MPDTPLATPVAFLIFNRPEATARVFAEIARARPSKLLVVADGPRPDRPGEAERCAAAREVVGRVDWDCEVLTDFSETNLGCRRRVSSGLDWVFRTVEEAIVLEDDCLPHPTFFRFCQELLQRYRSDDRIVAIGGTDFSAEVREPRFDYYFSRFNHVWGWASWRRAWRHYDVEMRLWPEVRDDPAFAAMFESEKIHRYWRDFLDSTYRGEIDTWDYQWHFACWVQSGLTVLPRGNLVSNIGFGEDASHTVFAADRLAGLPVRAMRFPLRHPPFVLRDAQADAFTQVNRYGPRSLKLRAGDRLRRMYRKYLEDTPPGARSGTAAAERGTRIEPRVG